MKKSQSGRKIAQTDRTVKRDELSRENETQDATSKELETRLQRLENAHSTGSTDVYKFAFFFFMGVVLTILIYPRVSSTFDNAPRLSKDNLQAKKADSGFDIEQIDDLEEQPSDENVLAGEKDKEPNRTKTRIETSDSKQARNKENTLNADQKHLNKRETETENGQHERERIKDDYNKETFKNAETEPEVVVEEFEDEGEPVILKQEKVEDLMVDEESKAGPISFSHYDGDTKEVNMNVEDNEEPRRVELFSANIDDIDNDRPTEKVNTNEPKPESKKKTSQKSTKSKKSGKTKSKQMSSKQNDEKDAKQAVNENIPKEIRDFKATYQKTLTPKKVFIDGRRIPPMELLPQKPNNSSVKVWLFEEFLSDEECDGLMRVHNRHVEEQSKDDPILCFDSVSTLRKHLKNVGKRVQITPNDFTKGTTCVNASFSGQLKEWFKGNWSYSTAFYPGESRFATVFEQRVKQAMGLNPENGGKFQITSYSKGIGYKSHTDCTENSDDKRDRMATVLVYLDTVSEGGETEFSELGIWARPRKGRALLWNNMNPAGDCEPMSIHKANKVAEGHKFILQRWYYYKSFYSLGKRPPEPPLPERQPGQPRVSCDEYEHGSCRWYDEWNFEHMIEYERQKYTLV